jgi:peptidoglycan/xylan/chitin deacetylase (PgdA/CDA1 family)
VRRLLALIPLVSLACSPAPVDADPPAPLLEPDTGAHATRTIDGHVIKTVDTHDHYAHTMTVDPTKFVYFTRKGDKPAVVLTFDCAWVPEPAGLDVLDALKRKGIKATFFLAGPFVFRDPFARGFDPSAAPLNEANLALAKRIVTDGHEIGNHSLTHPHDAPAIAWGPELSAVEVGWNRMLARAFPEGAPPNATMTKMWRAPYGEYSERGLDQAARAGFTAHVGWNTHLMDALGTPVTPQAMTRNVIAFGEKNKGLDAFVVLGHLGAPFKWGSDPAGLDALVEHFASRGWVFAKVSEVLKPL